MPWKEEWGPANQSVPAYGHFTVIVTEALRHPVGHA